MAGLNLRRTLFGGNDIAIDLGTANTLIYVKGVGVVVDEPTLLAVNKDDQSILTIGKDAKKLVGRVPDSIELVKPLRDGVISEIDMASLKLCSILFYDKTLFYYMFINNLSEIYDFWRF